MEFLARLGSGFKKGFVSFIDFFREGFKELRKVRWPNRKELTSYSVVVIFTVTFVAAFFFVVDRGIDSLLALFGF